MKTVDDYLTDLDQDLGDATKAFHQAEDLLQRSRRRLVGLMGKARELGLRGDEPRPPVWAELDGRAWGADPFPFRPAVEDQAVHRAGRVTGYSSQAGPKAQPKFYADGMATADLLDLLALAGIDVREAAKPHLERLKIDMPPGWPKPMWAAPTVEHHHQNCRCSQDPILEKRGAKVRGRKRR